MKNLFLTLFSILSIVANAQEDMCSIKFAEASDTLNMGDVLISDNTSDCDTIRVVVHVVYDGNASVGGYTGEISESQILSQITTTNLFFANEGIMTHPDNNGLGYAVKLATTDPFGNPTNGITYTDGTALWGDAWADNGLNDDNTNGVSAAELASAVGWGADINGQRYLNSYIVHRIDGHLGGGVQAYAYFPTLNNVYGNYNLYNTFGNNDLEGDDEHFILKTYTNRGLVWTHELMHNFGIFHTFQGNSCEPETNSNIQGDRVADTPPQTKGYSCTGACGFVSHNLMDYLNEGCKHLITVGQAERANLAIQHNLQAYLVCNGCNVSSDLNTDGGVNIVDFSILSSAFGCVEGDDCYNALYDLNCDGGINVLDFSILSDDFGHSSLDYVQGYYNMMGEGVDKNTRGLIIVKYKSGKTEKILNR